MLQNNMFQPFAGQPYIPNFQPSQNQLVKVNGLESAKAYQTAPNSTYVLFDGDNDIFYIKSTDASNFPLIRSFRFEEIVGDDSDPKTKDFITREEFDIFKEEVLKHVKQPIQQTKQNGSANANGKQSKAE